MKTQQEYQLYYWGPHFEMVKEYNAKHGCDVKPWECVKLGDDTMESHPSFDFPAENYTFAVAILYDDKRKEHRPVFVNDRLCLKNVETYLEVTGCVKITEEHYAWNQPAPKKWFRVAKLAGGMVVAADNDMDELSIKTSSGFVEWITKERVYYD